MKKSQSSATGADANEFATKNGRRRAWTTHYHHPWDDKYENGRNFSACIEISTNKKYCIASKLFQTSLSPCVLRMTSSPPFQNTQAPFNFLEIFPFFGAMVKYHPIFANSLHTSPPLPMLPRKLCPSFYLLWLSIIQIRLQVKFCEFHVDFEESRIKEIKTVSIKPWSDGNLMCT